MDPIKQESVGSKKNLYVIIGVVVILLLGGYLMRGSFGNRNLTGSTTYSDSEGAVTIGGNKLPDNWPADAPTYPNAKISFSSSSNPRTGTLGSAVTFTTSDNLKTVVDFYKRELASNGWKVEQAATIGASTVLSGSKDARTFGVYVTDAGTGMVSVTIGISGGSNSQ